MYTGPLVHAHGVIMMSLELATWRVNALCLHSTWATKKIACLPPQLWMFNHDGGNFELNTNIEAMYEYTAR